MSTLCYLSVCCLFRMIETSRFGAWIFFFECSQYRYLAVGCCFSNDRDVEIWRLAVFRMVETSRFGAWLFFEWSKRRDLALGCSSNGRGNFFGAWLSCCSNDREMALNEMTRYRMSCRCVLFFEHSSNRLGHRLGH